MTTSTSADVGVDARWLSVVRVLGASIAVAAGLWATLRVGYWFLNDDLLKGWVQLYDPWAARRAAALAVVVLIVGVAAFALRKRMRGAAGLALLAGVVALCVIGAVLAVASYPGVVESRVSGLDPESGAARWTTRVPLTVVSAVSEDTGDRVTVTGTYMDHGCEGRYLAVTLDRGTGEVVHTETLPGTHYPGTPPAPEEVLAEHGLAVDQGSRPFSCAN